jgi:hypothetical protein
MHPCQKSLISCTWTIGGLPSFTRRGTGHGLESVYDDASKLHLMQLPRRRICSLGKRSAGFTSNGIGNRLGDQECWPISRMHRSCLPSLGKRLPWADSACLPSTKTHRRACAGVFPQFKGRQNAIAMDTGIAVLSSGGCVLEMGRDLDGAGCGPFWG